RLATGYIGYWLYVLAIGYIGYWLCFATLKNMVCIGIELLYLYCILASYLLDYFI
ncbi:hypothetical protein F4823DRAFT_605465, partial [Ustulina deusta]